MRAVAYVNWGLWVADCPRPSCPNSEHWAGHCNDPELGRRCQKGHVGGLDDVFRCSFCGGEFDVVWPADTELIDAALSRRVVPTTRNWLPGESVQDLLDENLAHAGEVV